MLRKIIIGLAILLVLVLAAAVVLPIIFKDEIIAKAKEAANENLNARVDFGDIDITLFRNFPDFTLTVENFMVSGINEFEGIDLARVETFEVSLDLMSVINGERYQVNSIGLVRPNLHVIVLQDGTANYDIVPESDAPEEEAPDTTTTATEFNVGLQEYYIREANIIYDDRQGGIYADLKNFTHEGSGDFTQDDFLLKTTTSADAITARMEGVTYLSSVMFDSKFDIDMNLPNMKFVFKDNYVKLNALNLGFNGSVAMPPQEDPNAEGPIDLDLTFQTTETSFKSLLSLVPAVFKSDFNDVETEGSLELNGMAKGRMEGDLLPAFALNLKVNDARFKYPDLPKSVENIQIDLEIQNPGGTDDNTLVDLNAFHAEIAGNPIDMTAHIKTPVSNPFLDATVKANLNLASLKDVVQLEEGQELDGTITADIAMSGYQSALDAGQYDQFKAEGQLILLGLVYEDPEMPSTVINSCYLTFSPQYADLSKFDMKIGKSDVQANGKVENIVSWYVADEPLKGRFNMTSTLLDLNEFMEEEEGTDEAVPEESTEESMEVFEVPANFDFVLNSNIKQVIYDNLNIYNLDGVITIKDQRASLQQLSMHMMDGTLAMNGFYDTKNPISPAIDFNLNVGNWDVVETFTSFASVQKMAPIMEKASGKFSTDFKIAGALDNHMEPKYETLNGGGRLTTHNVLIQSPKTLERIAEAIKYNDLKDLVLDNVNINFEFIDGRVHVEPVKFNAKSTDIVFSGSHGFDQTLDYLMNLQAPTSVLGGTANQAIGGLLAQANKAAGTNLKAPETIDIDIIIQGTSDDPKITPRIGGSTASNATDNLKEQAKEELNKRKEELENKAKEEVDKARKEAEQKAREASERLKKEAEAKKEEARKKAEAEKKRIEEEARKRAEAEKKKAEEEAKKKAKDALKGVFK